MYDAVSPGLAAEIIAAFKSEYQQRHNLESTAMKGDIEAMRLQNGQASRGQWLGFAIALGFFQVRSSFTLAMTRRAQLSALVGWHPF